MQYIYVYISLENLFDAWFFSCKWNLMEISFASDTNQDKVITRYSAHVRKIVLMWKVQMFVIISHPSK